MSKYDKLLERFRELDVNLRFADVDKVMRKIGYTGSFPNGGSSHCTYRKRGCVPITIPTHEPIGREYIKLVRDVIKREREKQKDD